ncbi:MAG: hypothetical protein ACR2PV_02170 [Gammaproteobacteria bacterium]
MKNIICLFGVLCLLTISGQFTDEAVAARSCQQWIGDGNGYEHNRCLEQKSVEEDAYHGRLCQQWILHGNGSEHKRCLERRSMDE